MMFVLRKGWISAGILVVLAAMVLSQETVEQQPKVVILFDVSRSMNTIDGPEQPGRDPLTLPSRQDQVMRFLSEVKDGDTFVGGLLKKASVSAYRFGATLDQVDVAHFEAGKKLWSAERWTRWLQTDPKLGDLRDGSDIAGSALAALEKEKDSHLQAVIIVSDGRDLSPSRDDIDDFLDEARRRSVPVFTIGVGDARTLPRIVLHALQAPQSARPDAKFTVRVPVEGRGLGGTEFQVQLEAERVLDAAGKPVTREKRYLPGPKTGKFTAGAMQHVDYDVDPTALHPTPEGTWRFTARTPSHPREAFATSEHVSTPIDVVVQDRKVRVLLFSGGASREFQFLRTLLTREAAENRLDFSVLLSTSDDMPLDGSLKEFPDSLSAYDVVIALDPDWSKVDVKKQTMLKDWVATHAGSVIFAAGTMHTYRLARPAGFDLSAVIALFPVVPRDSRLNGLANPGVDPSKPFTLKFGPTAKNYPFLKLDDKGNNPTAGWDAFFRGKGFYSYYHVERLKPGSDVIAVINGPEDIRIGDRTDAYKDQHPYLVRMPHGSGMTWYLGGQETWRLRALREEYHAKFWTGLIRHTAASRGQVPKRGQLVMPHAAVAGTVPIEARLLGRDLKPLAADEKLSVEMRNLSDPATKPRSFALTGQEAGRFTGQAKFDAAGDHVVRVAIPESAFALSHRVAVRAADRESDNVNIDFGSLYDLASDAKPVLDKLTADRHEAVDAALRASADKLPAARRLFFRLADAHALPASLDKLPSRQVVKLDPPRPRPPRSLPFGRIKVLVIDGERADGRKEGGDSFHIANAIASIPKMPYEIDFADKLVPGQPTAAAVLERVDLDKYGAVLLLNVPELSAKQVEYLEAFTRGGGGIAFFLGPKVDAPHYNKSLYKKGKGVFPAPLHATYYPPPQEGAREPAPGIEEQLLLRDDLFFDKRLPIFGEIFTNANQRGVLRNLPVYRYFKVDRQEWNPQAAGAFELATLPNDTPIAELDKKIADVMRLLVRAHDGPRFPAQRPALARHIKAIGRTVGPGSMARAFELAAKLETMLVDPELQSFWRDPVVRPLLEDAVRLHQHARYGDPLMIGGRFGHGRTIAVMTTAGKAWTDFPGGSMASMIYAPFIWEMLDHLTADPETRTPRARRVPEGPHLVDVAPLLLPRMPVSKNEPRDATPVYLVTPDAVVPLRGMLHDAVGLSKAHWIVQVEPEPGMKPTPELRVPLSAFAQKQRQRAFQELTRDLLAGLKDKPFPPGLLPVYALTEEHGIDFSKIPLSKPRKDLPPSQFVKVWLEVEGGKNHTRVVRSEPMRFLIASPNEALVQAFLRGPGIEQRLASALDDLRGAAQTLEAERLYLREPDANRDFGVVRLLKAAGSVRRATGTLTEAFNDLDAVVQNLQTNRVDKQHLARIRTLAGRLEALAQSKKLAEADLAMRDAAALVEENKLKEFDRRANEASAWLKALDKEIPPVQEAFVEWNLEGKLIQLLVEIERKQAATERERQRLERMLIEDLLKMK